MTSGFPRQLLERSPSERLAYFRAYMTAHPRLVEADHALLSAIGEPSGASLITVYGPTGSGKTTLRRRIEQQLIKQAATAMDSDPSHISVISLDAVAPDGGAFNWKDYYRRALLALDAPFVKRLDETGSVTFIRMSAAELRHRLELAMCGRRLVACVIDDAQHLAKMTSGRKLQDQLDCIKSLAEMSRTVHVLVGTYELLALRNLSGQLSRRSRDVHLPRYRMNNSEDVYAFKSVVLTFQRHLPLAAEPDLLKHWEYLYERSTGCVGVLKDWLTRTLAAVLEEPAAELQFRHLAAQALSNAQCLRMATEINEGENRLLREDEASRQRLIVLLGMKQPAPALTSSDESIPTQPKNRVRRHVGVRKARRDRVGAN